MFANTLLDVPISCKSCIIGGGIVGALESYYAYKDAQKDGVKICITVYEKDNSFGYSNIGQSSTNTSYNIVPSLTIYEILSVVPRGAELVEKLAILFSQPGGIRVDDVNGVNDSDSAINFKEAVALYGSDKNHDERTLSLLMLGKRDLKKIAFLSELPEQKHFMEISSRIKMKNLQKTETLYNSFRIRRSFFRSRSCFY